VQRLLEPTASVSAEIEQSKQLKMKVALGAAAPAPRAARSKTTRVRARCGGIPDSLRDRLGTGVVVLVFKVDGKVALVVSVSKDLTTGVQAGRLVKELAPSAASAAAPISAARTGRRLASY